MKVIRFFFVHKHGVGIFGMRGTDLTQTPQYGNEFFKIYLIVTQNKVRRTAKDK